MASVNVDPREIVIDVLMFVIGGALGFIFTDPRTSGWYLGLFSLAATFWWLARKHVEIKTARQLLLVAKLLTTVISSFVITMVTVAHNGTSKLVAGQGLVMEHWTVQRVVSVLLGLALVVVAMILQSAMNSIVRNHE